MGSIVALAVLDFLDRTAVQYINLSDDSTTINDPKFDNLELMKVSYDGNVTVFGKYVGRIRYVNDTVLGFVPADGIPDVSEFHSTHVERYIIYERDIFKVVVPHLIRASCPKCSSSDDACSFCTH